MSTQIKTFDFARLPIGVEVKDLSFVGELPKLLGNPHKADFYQIIWLTGGEAAFHIDFREVTIRAGEMLLIASGQVCRFDTKSAYSGKAIWRKNWGGLPTISNWGWRRAASGSFCSRRKGNSPPLTRLW